MKTRHPHQPAKSAGQKTIEVNAGASNQHCHDAKSAFGTKSS
jgi:hypothetical protein